jgi:hypothetical protein
LDSEKEKTRAVVKVTDPGFPFDFDDYGKFWNRCLHTANDETVPAGGMVSRTFFRVNSHSACKACRACSSLIPCKLPNDPVT